MKVKEVARIHGLDPVALGEWLKAANVPHRVGVMGGIEIEDGQNLEQIVDAFRRHHARERERALQERARHEAAELVKRQAMASMLVTSGFSFDGYTITKYSGYISGDDAVQIERGTAGFFAQATDVGASLMAALVKIRRNALTELKEAAYALGCNAVIGVDFDYLTLDPVTASSGGGTVYLPYVFGVTANGNAVVIERNAPAARG